MIGGTQMPKICEVIKYEGDNSTFIWKHRAKTSTVDIPDRSRIAGSGIFHERTGADLFGAGRYTLEI